MTTPIQDCYRVTFMGRAGYGDALRLTCHYRLTVAGALESFNSLLQALEAGPATVLMQATINSAVMDKIIIRSYTSPVVGGDLAVSITGSKTGDPFPQQTPPQVVWYTDFIGPAYRGKNKLWVAAESQATNGTWNTGAMTEFGNVADAFMTVYDPGTGLIPWMQLVVLSKELQQAEDVTSRIVTPDPRNQKSRTIGFGA